MLQEEKMKWLAWQLRKPHGEHSEEFVEKMNDGNSGINIYAINTLKLSPGNHVLEIGMANGYFIPKIFELQSNIYYTGLDYSKDMIELAINQNQSRINTGRVKFYPGNADNITFPDSSFNQILAVNVIYFWDNIIDCLQQCFRVLSPGGQIVLAIRPKESMQHLPFVHYGFNLYSAEEIVELLNEVGFKQAEFQLINEPDRKIDEKSYAIQSAIISAHKE